MGNLNTGHSQDVVQAYIVEALRLAALNHLKHWAKPEKALSMSGNHVRKMTLFRVIDPDEKIQGLERHE